ncbi:hypothetical protein SAMN05216349_10113 [Oribacterium sp. KHPX15]|uniref:DUF2304 domain-containing protein n=1 Tax=Oribacterium sp. KHPX15 TaxID=1855342 RepID=UPI000898C795|nr:DUF2304 domain-containing protein [Oribacterium sp. KHPX15]SDZ78054.1 hypothetical protein SAMN05216349_10113 [Oribacterium sp. KHPX15]
MMTPLFRAVLVVASVGTLTVVLNRIHKAKLNIEDSIFWILLVFMFVVFAVFPVVPDALAGLLGIYSTANFLFLFMIFILIMRLFSMSMRVSSLEDKLRNLVQELALKEKNEMDDKTLRSSDDRGVSSVKAHERLEDEKPAK